MQSTTDIAIIGGGLAGRMMALAAARAGLSATIIDKAPKGDLEADAFDGRSYAMAHSSVRMLRKLGLWDHLEQVSQPILDIKISDGPVHGTPSAPLLHFDHHDLYEGPMGHMVEDRHLRPALVEMLDEVKTTHYLDKTEIVDAEQEGRYLKLTARDGSDLRAKIAVCADGRTSAFAKSIGIGYEGWDYAQTSLVCALEHEHQHNGIAYQHFMPPGPLAILPLKGNRCSIVWTETKENADTIMSLDERAYLDVLRPRFGTFLGKIKLVGQRYSYPLNLSLARKFVAARTALIGDAAHGMHPIAGQGLNSGLRDIAALIDVITEAKQRGEDIGADATLARYQEWRRFDATTLSLALDSFNHLFSSNNPILRAIRTTGIHVIENTPSLKTAMMRQAAGLSGELPELMR